MAIPQSIDRTLLQTYLADHLTGASAGRARVTKMSEWYADSSLGPDLTRIAEQIEEEYHRLEDLIDELGLRQSYPKMALARLGELAGRLKANGRVFTGSPMTPLLELELMRSAVNGKQGLWEALAEYADELGLDAEELESLAERAGEQSEILTRLHAEVRGDALRPGAGLG
ncbi:MAG: hypothetical protein Q4G67_02360 [Actinomycetia bacterium]|nr:hypothetical protein [Actinomycetes bacterium]